jgi:hypothetical protein
MVYKTHLDLISRCLDSVGLKTIAKTHVGRGSGARMAELAGADESDIRRHGRWNQQALANCYLSSINRVTCRTIAGFSPIAGNYMLQRCAIEPPEELQNQLFTGINRYEGEGDWEETLALDGFIRMLKWFRVVILQDMAAMWDFPEMADNPIRQHHIFQSAAFQEFKDRLQSAMEADEHPHDQILQQAVPLIAERIDQNTSFMRNQFNYLETTMNNQFQQLQRSLHNNVLSLFDGSVPLYIRAGSAPGSSQNGQAGGASSSSSDNVGIAGDDQQQNQARSLLSTRKLWMSRGLTTVHEVWAEYTQGIDGVSIEQLDRDFNAQWRSYPAERKFYSRRSKLYNKIKAMIASGSSVEFALDYLESVRVENNWTLNALQENIGSVQDAQEGQNE